LGIKRKNSVHAALDRNLHKPVFASLLESRTTGLIIVGGALLHTVLAMLGLPSWQCPVRYGLGIPCPGCGLSRATTTLFEGDWRTSFTFHAFAPFFLASFLLIAVITVLPSKRREAAVSWVDRAERQTGVVAIFLTLFMVYWLIRLLFFRGAFINLIMG